MTRGILGTVRELDALVEAIEELERQKDVDAFARVRTLRGACPKPSGRT